MPEKELDFVPYNRITSKSDAFVTSEELDCFVQYLPSTRATSYNIKKDQHTAGTTEDYSDFTVPDVSLKISPKKLRRINPFNKNNSESLLLNKFNTDPEIIYPTVIKEVKTKQVDYSGLMLNPDQLEFLLALQNVRSQSVRENETKLNIDEFSVIEDRVKSTSFELDARYSEVIVGKGSGVFNTLPEEMSSQSFEESQIGDYIKKFGFDPKEVNIKKKFEVRTGNAKEKPEVNNYLQVVNTNSVSKPNTYSTSNQNNNNYNMLNVNVDNSTGSIYNIRQSKTDNFKHELNFFDNKEINNYRTEVKLSKNTIGTELDIEAIHKKLLDGLNQSPSSNEFNYFTEIKSAKNYNIFEFKEVLNLTEKLSSNTNYVSLSTYYNHFRTINNNYSQIKNDLNFTNNQVDYLTKISFNNKNTINKLYSTYNTYRNSILNMINNITKIQRLEFNENDLQFKAGLIKTISSLNRTNVIQINQLKEQLNFSNINMSFLNHRLHRYEVSKIEQTKKELNNLLNIFEENNFLSNLVNNKIGNVVNQESVLELINLSTNEKQLESLAYILKQSSSNIHAVKNIIDYVNLSKQNNFNIEKFNTQNVSNINKILNLTKDNIEVLSSNKISKNIFSSNISNISEEEINSIKINQNILKDINLSELNKFTNILRSYTSNEIKNNLNVLDVNLINNVQNAINVLNSPDNIRVINSIAKLDKNFKISNNNISSQEFKTLNMVTEKIDVNKINNITRKISRLNVNQIEDIQEVTENIDLHKNTIQKIDLLSSKIQKISNLVNIENKDIVELVNISKSSENKNSFKLSQNVTLSNQQVRNLINMSKSYNENVIIRDTYFDNINQINQISNNSTNIQRTLNALNNINIDLLNFATNENTTNVLEKINKTFKVSDNLNKIEELSTLNMMTNKIDVNKFHNIVRRISNINIHNIEDVKQVSYSNITSNIDILTSKLQKISNSINSEYKDILNIHKTSQNNNLFKTSNFSSQEIKNLINVSKSYNEIVFAKNSFLDNISQINNSSISNIFNKQTISTMQKISTKEIKNITNDLNILSQNKTEVKKLSSIFNNKTISNIDQSFVDNVNVFQTKISNFADKSKLKETIESLNITNKNYNNIFSSYKISQIIKKSDLKENIEQINIFDNGKNSTVINKYSFESNKKKIQNLYSELNLVQQNKIERRTSQNISQVFNELNQETRDIKSELKNVIREQRNIVKSTNNFVKALSKSQNLGQQNLYDFLNFSSFTTNNKTSNTAKYGDYNQVYNLLNVSKIEADTGVKRSVNKIVNETIRIAQKSEKISFDIHKVNNEKVFKITNTIKSTTNNYHEQREAEQKQEKLIEKKVDQLLTSKIENVTNNLVKNVLTKNEFDNIKRDIVYEILKVQLNTDEKLEQIKRETQQTVQNMLEKFLRS